MTPTAAPGRGTSCLTCSVPEAGRLLGIGRDAAYRAAADGTIPTLRLGRRIVVPVPKLMALLGVTTPDMDEAGAPPPANATITDDAEKERHRDQYDAGAPRSA